MESLRPSMAALRAVSAAPRTRLTPFPPFCSSQFRFRLRPQHQFQCQCLHSSSRPCAQVAPGHSIPGPAPEPPKQAASDLMDRVARKRKQAELMKQAQEIRSSSSASNQKYSGLQKRFWKNVSVQETEAGLQVFLDSRPVRTPNKEILTVPASKHQLATAIALEWDLLHSAQQALKTHYIPMTSLAARAVDLAVADAQRNPTIRNDIVKMFMRYLETDTLLCWAPEKNMHDVPQDGASLRDIQIELSTPIIDYLTSQVWPGVEIKPILEPDSIMPVSQPEMTKAVIRGWLSGLPAFELAGLERAVLASKSLLVGVRLVHEWGEHFATARVNTIAPQRFGIEEAAAAASSEVRWQTRQWGEVEDTHDVEREDMRRQLGSVVLLVGGNSS